MAETVTPEQLRALQGIMTTLPTPTELLDFQIETLVSKNLASYEDADPFRKNPPSRLFVLVPKKTNDLDNLMHLVVVNDKHGNSYLNEKLLVDEIKTPTGPYLCLNVEDGASRLNVKPSKSLKKILAEGRSPGTAYEGVIYAILFPDVLNHHFMDLCGSRCHFGGRPDLFMNDGEPSLNDGWDGDALPGWGAWSCAGRLSANI